METDLVETDFFVVRLSADALAYLDGLDRDWRHICANKRLRSKHAKLVREGVDRVVEAVKVASAIAYYNGKTLSTF